MARFQQLTTNLQCSHTQLNIGLTAATPATPTPIARYKGIRDPRDKDSTFIVGIPAVKIASYLKGEIRH